MTTETRPVQIKPNIFDIFIGGARKGWNLATQNLVPNILMAYVIAYILNILGVMDFLGYWLGPIMGIFGTVFRYSSDHLAVLFCRGRCGSFSLCVGHHQWGTCDDSHACADPDGFPDPVHGPAPRPCRCTEKILAPAYGDQYFQCIHRYVYHETAYAVL